MLQELGQWSKNSKGFYIDIGAHHPFRFSNTAIYHKRGWNGINVDATPGSMVAFNKMRPKDINLECAVSSDARERIFYIYNEPALNGIDCDRSEEFAGTKFKLLRKISIQTHTLASILQSHIQQLPKPNFLTIDVEGHDLEVLQSNDWNKFRFDWVLCEIQVGSISDLACNPVYKYISDKGYHLRAFTGRTGIFEASV